MKLIRNKTTQLIEFAFDNDSTAFLQTATETIIDGKPFTSIDYEEILVVGQNVPTTFVANVYYWDNAWVESPVYEIAWNNVRKERNKRLAECDWTQLTDVTLVNKADWDTYRQALRDLPTNTLNPFLVEWPTQP